MNVRILLLTAVLTTATLTLPAAAESYGEGVELTESTPIAAILDAPQSFAGKRVRVEGEVADVCPAAGCWMVLADAGRELRVKVEDGVIVFPQTARGGKAVAEGVIEVKSMSREDYTSWQAHLAEEKGEAFDAASVGDGPFLFVQLRGTGAEISAPPAAGAASDGR
ncbi:MAG: DUF4920 domain-containing protein [Acidobacteria bacterium]|nr:DUF4920 domain-containing protein [Acidobacteriota bacterium]